LVEDALRPDEAGRVKHDPGPLRVLLDHRARLDVEAVLLGPGRDAIGVLVGDGHGQLLDQLGHGDEDGRGVRELGEDDEPDGKERGRPRYRGVDHRQHAVGVRAHLSAVDRVGQVGLAAGGGIADVVHDSRMIRPVREWLRIRCASPISGGWWEASYSRAAAWSGASTDRTTRVLYRSMSAARSAVIG